MKKVLMNWSGGKDSSLCLHYLLKSPEYEVVGLLTSVNDAYNRVSMHGIREALIKKQAEAIGIPLHLLRIPGKVTMEEYDQLMRDALQSFRSQGVEYCAFGDIFLEDLRLHREEKLKEINMKGLFPLWKQSTQELARQFIDDGFKAVLTSLDGSQLDESFIGRSYDKNLLKNLPDDVDPCGEYGEFHSFVFDGPIFKEPVNFEKGEVVERTYEESTNSDDDFDNFHSPNSAQPQNLYWFVDLKMED